MNSLEKQLADLQNDCRTIEEKLQICVTSMNDYEQLYEQFCLWLNSATEQSKDYTDKFDINLDEESEQLIQVCHCSNSVS